MTRTVQGELFQPGYGAVGEASAQAHFQSRSLASPVESMDGGALGALSDLEALTRLLACCSPSCGDAAGVAEALLARFGCWPRTMGASAAELASVAGAAVAADLRLVRDLLVRGLEFEVRKRSVLSSWSAVHAYLRASLGGQARESFRVFFLDRVNALIADELMGQGTIDHAPVYPREIMRRALELNAAACCLVHNHPSGSADPSSADIEMTRRVVEAGQALGISVHDHFLVGGDRVVSFKGLGLM